LKGDKMDVETLATRLGGKIKLKSGGYLARCPAHNDKNPSLTLMEVDGKILWHCKVGCTQKAVGEKIKPLLEEEDKPRDWKLIKRWEYTDISDQPALRVSRYECDGKKTFKQERSVNGMWEPGGALVEITPLYYPLWRHEQHVFFVEGEKCADILMDHGIAATCIPGGANGWKEYYSRYFVGKDVTILPDNDEPGHKFAETVKQSIFNSSIKPIPNLKDKQDVFDWIQAGNDPKTLLPKAPLTLREEIEEVRESIKVDGIPFGIKLLDDAMGCITQTDLLLLSGLSGHGKTQIAMHLAEKVAEKKKRVTFFSLESFKREVESRMIYGMLANKFFENRKYNLQDQLTHISYRRWLHKEDKTEKALGKYYDEVYATHQDTYSKHLNFIYRDHSQFTVKDFENFFRVHAPESDLVIVDHLNYFDSHDEKKGEWAVQKEIIKRIRDCVLLEKTPVLLLTHVKKKDGKEGKLLPDMDDIYGSSDVFKIATKSLMIGQDFTDYDPRTSSTYIRIHKDRYGDALGRYIFKLKYDIAKRSYNPEYLVGKIMREKGKEIFELLESSRLPDWATPPEKNLGDPG
jgi:hypothetical protein